MDIDPTIIDLMNQIQTLISEVPDLTTGLPDDVNSQLNKQAVGKLRDAYEGVRDEIEDLYRGPEHSLEGMAETPSFEEYAQPIHAEFAPLEQTGPEQPTTDDRQQDGDEISRVSTAETPSFEEYAQPIYAEFAPPEQTGPEQDQPAQEQPATDARQQAVDAIVHEETAKCDARIAQNEEIGRARAADLSETYANDQRLPAMLDDLQRGIDANEADLRRQRDATIERRIEVEVPQLPQVQQVQPPQLETLEPPTR